MLAMTAIRRGRGRGGAPYYSAGVPPDPPVPSHDAPAAEAAVPPRPRRRRISVNTAIFSIGTGLSRIAGLVREILASSYFGTSGPFSAFTIAFQIPNLLRQLVADYAVSAAFVPVFTELLEKDRKRDAFRLASTLFFLILIVLGAITALFVVAAPVIMPLFTGDTFSSELDQLTVGLSQVLFPIVVLLGLNGLCVGILNAYDHFTVPAFAPLAWNLVIIGLLIVLRPLFSGPDQLYAYAIAVLVGTAVQFALALPAARGDNDRLRAACANGMRQIFLLLIPAAAITVVLSTPIIRLIYQHGSFGPSSTEQVSEALFWFSFSLPLNGVNLLLTRTFFSLQEPWRATQLAAVNVGINFAVSLALYGPFGIAGLVIGTVIGNAGMMVGQAYFLRRQLHGLEGRRTAVVTAQVLGASLLLALVSYGVWYGLDAGLGRSLGAQIVSVLGGIVAGLAVFAAAVTAMRVPEAHQIRELVQNRFRSRPSGGAP